jgi:hypothetical protein
MHTLLYYAVRAGGRKDGIRTWKAHSYVVMAGSGILSTMAAWPRPDGAKTNAHMVKLVTLLTEMHRTITTTPITPAVSKMFYLCFPWFPYVSCRFL